MARRRNNAKQHVRSRKNRGGNGGSNVKYIFLGISLIVIIGLLVWWILRPSGEYEFHRAYLDEYVETEAAADTPALLGDGVAVYLDMSDGMNFAYEDPAYKAILKDVINKLGANKAVEFNELSEDQIIPVKNKITVLYNYMTNPANYAKQRAPIEQTLATILEKNQPALIMSDFEEYNNGVIQKAAYAKAYFIEWLKRGYNIYFYKWTFMEKGNNKAMFIAVFDDNSNRLNREVATVLNGKSGVDRFVLAGPQFAYPIYFNYPMAKGGNYHNEEGKDDITYVREEGGKEDYRMYSATSASASGDRSNYMTLDYFTGSASEFYPFGMSWEQTFEYIDRQSQLSDGKFRHLISNLYIDFDAQDGFDIEGIEVRTFDMNAVMEKIWECNGSDETLTAKELSGIRMPEINGFLTASLGEETNFGEEICIDFAPTFKGRFNDKNIKPNSLIRANIVISKPVANIDDAEEFFSWPGNTSLFDSVKQTLQAQSSNPSGRLLYTYYLIAPEK